MCSKLRLGRRNGHEQHGERFGVIVQWDALLPRSTVLTAPTSSSAMAHSLRPEVDVDGSTARVIVEQMRAVDVSRDGDLVGRLTPRETWGVDEALRRVLDLR